DPPGDVPGSPAQRAEAERGGEGEGHGEDRRGDQGRRGQGREGRAHLHDEGGPGLATGNTPPPYRRGRSRFPGAAPLRARPRLGFPPPRWYRRAPAGRAPTAVPRLPDAPPPRRAGLPAWQQEVVRELPPWAWTSLGKCG